ncbi:MAG: phage portal protein [Deltaproteobacteria bacterium]|nr:phage portal protein [Deltaproteobacteria bacterium]
MGRWQSFKNFVWGKKESRTASIITTPASGGVIWTPKGYDNFAKETYLKNATAFASIVEISTNVASVPWAQYRRIEGGKREVVTDTAVASILKRANPQESFQAVMLAVTAYLAMSGNTFFERVTPESGPNKEDIKELYSKRPDRFKLKVNPSSGQLEKYIYSVDGRSVDWEVDPLTGQADILHLKSFHPLDDWWGAAPTESAAREIDTSNAATQWNMSLLQNQGRPGMIFTLIGALGEQQFDELEKRLAAKTGATEVGKNMIITGERGTKAEPFGWSPTDMDFSEGDLRLMRKIAMAYRVPPMILGIPGEATFANFKEARLAFWESTIFYYLNYLRGELNNWLHGPDSDMFIDYILDDIPALTIKRDAVWKRAQESDFLTLDEKRELVGKDKYEPSEEPGSMIFIEASKIPIGVAMEEEEVEKEEETVKMLQDEGYSEEEIDMFLGYKYSEIKEKFDCECIDCGYKLESDKHCMDIKCPKCKGKMRRQGRPGQGKEDE